MDYKEKDAARHYELAEMMRRELQEACNSDPRPNEEMPEPRWTTEELQRDFQVHGFLAPFVMVTRLSDGVTGTLMFRHLPRIYYGWKPE